MPEERAPRGAVAGVLAVLLLASYGTVLEAGATAPTTSNPMTAFDHHVDHIVFLLQENHAYDALFGTYCQALTHDCPMTGNGLPPGTCVPENPAALNGPCVRPFNFTMANLTPPDMPHDWYSTHTAFANGTNQGFYKAELNRTETFGHYNGTTAPVYWDLAEEYALSDDFFSSAASYSLPNHWYLVASKPPVISERQMPEYTNGTSVKFAYLNESNTTPNIEQELVHSSVSWAYYDYALPTYQQAINPSAPGVAYDFWNPLASTHASYKPGTVNHFVDRTQFYGDAANGTLPNISWIIPSTADSDHPPANLSTGQDWVASIVNALEASPEWNSTVLFLSWDEYGGFYDHVAPPTVDAFGDGFRVPMLAIGPYVKQGFIDGQNLSFSSILHLMEKRFGLACLGRVDCEAALPLAVFNFQRSPRAPLQVPDFANASYPMPLQSSGKLPPFAPGTPVAWPPGLDTELSFAPGYAG